MTRTKGRAVDIAPPRIGRKVVDDEKREEMPAPRYVADVPTKRIRPLPNNIRRKLGDLTEMTASVRAKGVLQPVLVEEREDGDYDLLGGHRRHAAAELAGLSSVPAMVYYGLTAAERVEIMVIENCQRVDVSTTEEADGYRQLVALGRSHREIAEKVGKSQAHVTKRLSLLELPKVALEQLDSGGITLADAYELVKLKDHPKRIEACLKMRGGPMGYRVSQELREMKSLEAVKAARARCKREGLEVVKNTAKWGFVPPEGVYAIGTGWGALELDPEQHAAEPCHAVGVDPSGHIVPCCTDRTRHPEAKTKGESAAGGEDRARAAAEEERRESELRAAEGRRREVAKVAIRQASTRALLQHSARCVIADIHHADFAAEVCELIGVKLAQSVQGREALLLARRVLDAETIGEIGSARVLTAYFMVLAEREMGPCRCDQWGNLSPLHVKLLGDFGLVLSDAEAKKLSSYDDGADAEAILEDAQAELNAEDGDA